MALLVSSLLKEGNKTDPLIIIFVNFVVPSVQIG